MRVLTWHIHGGYLWYLSGAGADPGYELFLPTRPGRPEGYGARTRNFPWPPWVHEVPADAVRDLDIDVVLTQSRRNWEVDRHELLSSAQLRGPRIHLEHDPPREHPTDTRHPVDDPGAVLVHVTAFNDLMWHNGRTPTFVIEHGVPLRDATWTGELDAGVVVVNGLPTRGRRDGVDIVERVRQALPLTLAGIGSEHLGGVGDVPHERLDVFCAPYRFFFNPIRYTSLGLAVCEAMALGMPVVGLATTEMATVIDNGVNGIADTDVGRLITAMQELLADQALAAKLGTGARETARERFSLSRFTRQWRELFAEVG